MVKEMNEYTEYYKDYCDEFEARMITTDWGRVEVDNPKDHFFFDEVEAEENWSNYADAYFECGLVSLEDCLEGNVDLATVYETQVVTSWINGQKKQAVDQLRSNALDGEEVLDVADQMIEKRQELINFVKEVLL